MFAEDQMEELRQICSGAVPMADGTLRLVHLPNLQVPTGGNVKVLEGLLCPTNHSGYETRLFLSEGRFGRVNNWTSHQILGKTWHTWSWQGVSASLRLAEILALHLKALR